MCLIFFKLLIFFSLFTLDLFPNIRLSYIMFYVLLDTVWKLVSILKFEPIMIVISNLIFKVFLGIKDVMTRTLNPFSSLKSDSISPLNMTEFTTSAFFVKVCLLTTILVNLILVNSEILKRYFHFSWIFISNHTKCIK